MDPVGIYTCLGSAALQHGLLSGFDSTFEWWHQFPIGLFPEAVSSHWDDWRGVSKALLS